MKTSNCFLADILGGYIIRFTWCHTDISLYLPISWLFRMGSHWPHWKAKSSLWALAVSNGGREGGRGREGGISEDLPGVTLTFPYIFLLFDCFKWALIDCIEKQRVHSALWQFWMGGGREGGRGVYLKIYLVSHWHFLISSYYLTVSNGRSLTALKSVEFTQCSGSFKWGEGGRDGGFVSFTG